MRIKLHLSIFLIVFLISGSLLVNITPFGFAQSSFKISGYILDSDGNGVSGANIIFNVPSIVPSVYSDSLGYYEIIAPEGIYHVNVWPPFDSNFIYYDEPRLVVASDITKNITLNSGYKLSGYIFDESGQPVKDGIVALGNYISGWFSTYYGYYFATAPSGTYNINARPRAGYSHFTSYYEYNFILDGNIEKNITVSRTAPTTPTPTPDSSPIPSPTPFPSPSASPFPSPTPFPVPTRTRISISTDVSSSLVGSAVNVNGKLSYIDGSVLSGKTVILSFAVGNSFSWIPIGSAITNENGNYNIQWINDASGIFSLKVEWTEDFGYQTTANTTSVSFLPYNNQNLFHVESNSTVSALAFNSTSSKLGFVVSGPDGTQGYVKTTIAKNLVSNPENIQVYLDGNELNYDISSISDSWILTFAYTHSTHQISIELSQENNANLIFGVEYWMWFAIVVICIIVVSLLIYFKKLK